MDNSRRWSAGLCNASMLLYIGWLMLPMVQVRLKAVTGVLALALFGVGVLLDGETLKAHWRDFLPRVLCLAALPLLLIFFLYRGGNEMLGFYAEQVMFWFPLLWCAYARQRGAKAVYRFVFPVMLAVVVITTLTTIGWLIEGMLREEGKVYAYARSLGDGSEGRQVYLNELMSRNIGGYGFIYASVFALPFTFFLAGDARGWRRFGFTALYVLQLIVIALSQYTYAIIFAAAITAAELLGLMFRALWKKLSVAASLWCTVAVIVGVFAARIPLVGWLKKLADALHFANIASSLSQLLAVLRGGGIVEGSRLDAYATSWNSFLTSPFVGGVFSGQAELGMHSELLDALAGMGILGTAVFAAGVWAIGRGMGKNIRQSDALPHLGLQWIALAVFMVFGTVVYAREIPLMICLCTAFAVWTAQEKSSIIKQI